MGLDEAWAAAPGAWPWATLAANLAGSALLGWLWARLSESPGDLWRPLLGTGFCGGLTTFSAFQVEALALAADGHAVLAAAYVVVSLGLGMACAVAGTRFGRRGGSR